MLPQHQQSLLLQQKDELRQQRRAQNQLKVKLRIQAVRQGRLARGQGPSSAAEEAKVESDDDEEVLEPGVVQDPQMSVPATVGIQTPTASAPPSSSVVQDSQISVPAAIGIRTFTVNAPPSSSASYL
jgi:hypothetical protein